MVSSLTKEMSDLDEYTPKLGTWNRKKKRNLKLVNNSLKAAVVMNGSHIYRKGNNMQMEIEKELWDINMKIIDTFLKSGDIQELFQTDLIFLKALEKKFLRRRHMRKIEKKKIQEYENDIKKRAIEWIETARR